VKKEFGSQYGNATRRRSVHLDVANKPTILFQMLADGLQRFLSQLLFCVEEEAEGCDEVEEAIYTEVSGVRGWEIRWRFAKPEDVRETVC
jgi:hypothetical protein